MNPILLNIYTDALDWLGKHSLPCVFRMMFHTDCPGCGFQRSLLALLRGDVYNSIKLYPGLLPMLLFFVFLIADRKFRFRHSNKLTGIGLAFVFIIIFGSYIIKITK